jgi:phosphatidylinositol alpha-mannosyltransferase
VVATFHRAGGSHWYRALRPVVAWARRRIDLGCAVSEAARRTAVDALGGQYDLLFNGVEMERFAAAVPAPNGGRPTVLFLGRHEERKGLGVLLAAFAGLGGSAQLWVAGDGPQTEELRRRFPPSERVRWLGLLSEEEVATHLAGADVLCAPSLGGESFGMVLVEAMAARCAVVASDLDGYRAAAEGHAYLFPPGDEAALARALDDALADAAAGTGRSGPIALDAALAHADAWSMDRLAEAYEARYGQILRSRDLPPGAHALGG